MWRDLHAAIFGSSAQNTPAAKKPRAATATVFDTAGFAAFQAAVKNAAVTPVPFDSDAPASVTAPDLSGPPAPWRTRDDAHKGPHGFVAVVGGLSLGSMGFSQTVQTGTSDMSASFPGGLPRSFMVTLTVRFAVVVAVVAILSSSEP